MNIDANCKNRIIQKASADNDDTGINGTNSKSKNKSDKKNKVKASNKDIKGKHDKQITFGLSKTKLKELSLSYSWFKLIDKDIAKYSEELTAMLICVSELINNKNANKNIPSNVRLTNLEIVY
eukprot:CAMPEP_0116902376 /NCGR_PEP_ID=MMETSP0467-20121206/9989_1 /TAXON_ID=283647 /ORGANISM="Mesodinium pulex, Strain SPMC105" /LENGTH=122 /DNA_ID=CAMNT_0004576223 /DNA_START=1176 /DNA_END=1544 /DNA_ORIENTATION=-